MPTAAAHDALPDLQRGRWLMDAIGCADCHGATLLGQSLLAADSGVVLSSPSLRAPSRSAALAAPGGLWRRLRFGVDDERRALWGMPRHALLGLKDDDTRALIAAVAALAPHAPDERIDLPQSHLVARGYVAVALRTLWLSDRDDPMAAAPLWALPVPAESDADHGAYVVRLARCAECHQAPQNRPQTMLAAAAHAPALRDIVASGLSDETWRARWRQSGCKTVPSRLPTADLRPVPRETLFSAATGLAMREHMRTLVGAK